MGEKLRTPDEPSDPVVYQQYILTLPVNADISRFFWGAVISIAFHTAWVDSGTMDTRTAADYIKQALNSRKEFDMLGVIVSVTRDSLHSSMLVCDGGVYNKEDYPQLWDVLPSTMKDATTLTLPDLRNLFLVGAGLDYSLADTGGIDEVTLTTDEIPSHDHSSAPHSHTDGAAAPTVVTVGAGAPVPSAVPSAGITSFETVTISPTGGGLPHENRPPFYAVVYAMIAKVVP